MAAMTPPSMSRSVPVMNLACSPSKKAAAFLLGEHAKFITGTDLLIDGGVIAAIRTGEYQLG